MWVFVANHLNVICSLPVELLSGHFLRAASKEEEKAISDAAPGLGTRALVPVQAPETAYVIERKPGSAFAGLNGGFLAIEQASRLTTIPLDLSMYFIGLSSFGRMGNAILFPHLSTLPSGWQALEPGTYRAESDIDESYVADLQDMNRRIESVKTSHPDVVRALDVFRGACAIEGLSQLFVLGLFSVIELLLAHNPQGGYDSLTHQISTKLPLLQRRFKQPLDYSKFGADETKVWKTLYAYRSTIAHGGRVDFQKALKVLKGPYLVSAFLVDATRAVLRHALIEPDLVLDLRAV